MFNSLQPVESSASVKSSLYTGTFIPDLVDRVNALGSGDAYDSLVDLALDGHRIAPRWGIFVDLDGWRVAETDHRGVFVKAVFWCVALGDAIAQAKLMNQAEALCSFRT